MVDAAAPIHDVEAVRSPRTAEWRNAWRSVRCGILIRCARVQALNCQLTRHLDLEDDVAWIGEAQDVVRLGCAAR